MPTSPNLVTIKAAAQRASVHPMTIRRWISQGLITGYRLGPRALRVDIDQLDALAKPIPTTGQ